MKDIEVILFDSMKTKEIIVLYDLIASSYSSKFTKAKFAYGFSSNIIIFKYDCFYINNDNVIYDFEL